MKDSNTNNLLSRKEAVTKISKYAVLTALGTFIILNPLKAQATSPPAAGGDPFD